MAKMAAASIMGGGGSHIKVFISCACGATTDDSLSFSAGINSQLTQAVIDVGFIACLRSRDSRVTNGSFNHAAFAITLSLQARRYDSHQLSSPPFFFGLKMLKCGT